jgi:SET domain-containing protein
MIEYSGMLRAFNGIDKTKPDPAKVKPNTGFTMLLRTRPTRPGYFSFIEAEKHGSIARFLNQFGTANTAFRELRNRRAVKVAVVTMKAIEAGEELTVDYGDEVWFPCLPLD